jgi:aminomethyltransferase
MTTPPALLRTPLYDWHQSKGARLVEFAGWEMPVQYTSIIEEHQATRSAVGLFDVSHMGRIHFDGPDAARFLDQVLTRRVLDLRPWRARYSFICNEHAGILDDVLIYRLWDTDDVAANRPAWQLVVNASNRLKILGWLGAHRGKYDVRFEDVTLSTVMIAVQGPRALEIVAPLSGATLSGMKYFQATAAEFQGIPGYASRTGYTGEDGIELICAAKWAEPLWSQLVQAAQRVGGCAVGLAARDTLRLEAALPLYGHELSEAITPVQAGLPFAYDLERRKFIGCDVIRRLEGDETLPVRAGVVLHGRRPARQDARVLYGGTDVGQVTSGTFSPSLDRPIALAYVHRPANTVGRELTVDIRGHRETATVVPLPFYKRG